MYVGTCTYIEYSRDWEEELLSIRHITPLQITSVASWQVVVARCFLDKLVASVLRRCTSVSRLC